MSALACSICFIFTLRQWGHKHPAPSVIGTTLGNAVHQQVPEGSVAPHLKAAPQFEHVLSLIMTQFKVYDSMSLS
jgi:hypothetical protein